MRIFSVAAVFGLAGMALEERWLTGVAIVILLAGFGLRFLPTGGEAGDEDREEDEA